MHNDARHFNQAPQLMADAAEEVQGLADVFAWINELFVSIDDATENKTMADGVALIRIARLAALGRTLATDWQYIADSMSKRITEEAKKLEASHA